MVLFGKPPREKAITQRELNRLQADFVFSRTLWAFLQSSPSVWRGRYLSCSSDKETDVWKADISIDQVIKVTMMQLLLFSIFSSEDLKTLLSPLHKGANNSLWESHPSKRFHKYVSAKMILQVFQFPECFICISLSLFLSLSSGRGSSLLVLVGSQETSRYRCSREQQKWKRLLFTQRRLSMLLRNINILSKRVQSHLTLSQVLSLKG